MMNNELRESNQSLKANGEDAAQAPSLDGATKGEPTALANLAAGPSFSMQGKALNLPESTLKKYTIDTLQQIRANVIHAPSKLTSFASN